MELKISCILFRALVMVSETCYFVLDLLLLPVLIVVMRSKPLYAAHYKSLISFHLIKFTCI